MMNFRGYQDLTVMPTIRLIIPLSCINLSGMTLLRRIYKSQTFRYFDNSWLLKLESGRFHNFDILIFSLVGKTPVSSIKISLPQRIKRLDATIQFTFVYQLLLLNFY